MPYDVNYVVINDATLIYFALRTQTHLFASLSFHGKLCYVKYYVISCHV